MSRSSAGVLAVVRRDGHGCPRTRLLPASVRTDANFSTVTESGLVGSILSTVGDYPWQDTASGNHEPGTASYSLEQILRTDPDVIFVQTIQVTPDPPTPISELLADNPVWGQLKAVKNDHVIEVNALIWAAGRGTRSLGIILDQAQQQLAEAE